MTRQTDNFMIRTILRTLGFSTRLATFGKEFFFQCVCRHQLKISFMNEPGLLQTSLVKLKRQKLKREAH